VELEIGVGDGYIQCVRTRWLSWLIEELASARMLFSAGRKLCVWHQESAVYDLQEPDSQTANPTSQPSRPATAVSRADRSAGRTGGAVLEAASFCRLHGLTSCGP
jgi:hypothetical protein